MAQPIVCLFLSQKQPLFFSQFRVFHFMLVVFYLFWYVCSCSCRMSSTGFCWTFVLLHSYLFDLFFSLSLLVLRSLFLFIQQATRVEIWLFENAVLRLQGTIIGFDEYMNVVLDNASEVNVKQGSIKHIGRILLKGDNITLIRACPVA